ncbi:class I SAM-dependent methyltransferase [Novipirellula artificiosorum]|uniref:Demethylrebeccamycin-D-glucose O-methyltransferase n=1 Tax=Novipirellula artificiosorum TaxID=2528016 RepID=A0A5C6D2Q7_9BACT|nr:class I SAM-dependent methyltransferase [Novipirellula artificiosorum]TWU29139.1 hypothetical protein Poly41_67110 [Novipirellula artificiosorum]
MIDELNRVRECFYFKRLRYRVERILSCSLPPDTRRAESDFEHLQNKLKPLPEYGYDEVSCWRRACERFDRLLSCDGFDRAGKRLFDLGCGDGMLGVVTKAYGHQVVLADATDWRDSRAKGIQFLSIDASTPVWPVENETFDMVTCYNTFEHLPKPDIAFQEMLRICSPGGFVVVDFGPLYCSPWGLHAHRTLHIPFPQFLFGEGFIAERLNERGIKDLGQERESLQYTNRWTPEQFESLWRNFGSVIVVVEKCVEQKPLFLETIVAYPEAFYGRGLSLADVETQHIRVVFQKK